VPVQVNRTSRRATHKDLLSTRKPAEARDHDEDGLDAKGVELCAPDTVFVARLVGDIAMALTYAIHGAFVVSHGRRIANLRSGGP